MKNYINRILSLAAAVFLAAGCAETYVEEYVAEAPEIESFTPTSALSGDDTPVVITGQHLQAVTKAMIGGAEVRILERVSNTRMTVVASREARSGKITLVNSVGTAASASDFTVNYPVPAINAAELPEKVDMFGRLTLKGQYMAVIRKVIVTGTDAEPGEGREAEILSQDGSEVVVTVPYVTSETARITLRYMEADNEVETPLETAPSIGVVRLVPEVDEPAFSNLIVGRITTITGKNLDQISAVKVGGENANIASQSATELSFTVPMVEGFVEGAGNQTSLAIDYFGDFESAVIKESLPATVLRLKIWEGITTFCQDVGCIRLESFFSPETGIIYHNNRWRTEVDPVSYNNDGKVCSANNVPSVSEADYNSVNPYFYFSGVKAAGTATECSIQIMGPATSSSQFKNFFFEPIKKDQYRLLPNGGYGTPVLSFRYLDPSAPAEKALADKVRNLEFDVIDEASFPIDVEQKTVAGVPIAKPAGSSNSVDWAPGIFSDKTEKLDAEVDAVLMVLYFDYHGIASVDPLANVKRIGFIHITKVNFRPVSGAPSQSDITYNVYWQKEDYKF